MTAAILIVDDQPDEAALIKRAVLRLRPSGPVIVLPSAKELKDYVNAEGRYIDREAFPYPSLILLDLKMPDMNGFELLEWLKREPLHAAVPVIVVSSFDRQKDIRKSYQLGASTFLSKPVNPERIRGAVRALGLAVDFAD